MTALSDVCLKVTMMITHGRFLPASQLDVSGANPTGAPGAKGQMPPLLSAVFPQTDQNIPPSSSQPREVPAGSAPPPSPSVQRSDTPIVINPSALPAGAGVQLAVTSSGSAVLVPQLVYATAACTGS